jgi:prepilin-type N-terminal cleavage/methylation domain-containing protein
MQNRHSNKGFTIIELVVVIAVIGILMTVILVVYSGIQLRVIDSSVEADVNRMNVAELKYIESHGNAGKAYYSGDGLDADLNFVPSSGNVIDVAINATSFCIRGYNESGTKNSIFNAYSKGSTPTACDGIPPSESAGASIDAPAEPSIAVGLSGSDVLASISAVSCSMGTPQYGIDSRTNDGAWSGYSDWSTDTTASQPAVDGTKYGYRAHARCYVDAAIYSLTSTGDESTYTFYNYDSLPIATSISGYWSTPPTGYLLEDGSEVSRTTYADLFAVIGTTYGSGDGSTTFNLPDSRGRVTVSQSLADSEFDVIGEEYGEKTHLLTGSENGEKGHNHTQDAHGHTTNSQKWYGNRWAPNYASSGPGTDVTIGHAASSVNNNTAVNQAVSDTNASSSHNEIQPSIVKVYAIKWRPSTGSNSKLSAGTSAQGYFTSAPAGYLVEDGSAVSRTIYDDLFAAIGTTYGSGDGSTTFNLPDSRGRVAVNKNPTDVEFATLGQKYGEKTHLLTSGESGEKGHNHTQNAHSHTHNLQKWYGTRWDTTWTGTVIGADVTIGHNGASIGSTTATNQAVAASNASSAHNNIQPSIVKLSVIKYTPDVVSAEDNTAKGSSISGYWSSAPSGYLLEDGSAVSRVTYDDLFAVIGTTYGSGDGSTTFNLPDSRGRVAVNKNPSDTEFDTLGEKYGEKPHLNTGAESGLKGHNHTQNAHGHTTTGQRWYGTRWADSWASSGPGIDVTIGFNDASIDNQTATNQAVSASDAASAHNNIQPSIVLSFAIKY